MSARMRRSLLAGVAALAVTCGAQFTGASPSGAEDGPIAESGPQQFNVPQTPPPLRAQIHFPSLAGTSKLLKERKVDLNPSSASPQVTYSRSQEIKDSATLSELVKKGVCVWNEALGTPCDSPKSFLVEGVQPSTGSRAGITIDVGKPDDMGFATGTAGVSCTATECRGHISLASYLKNNKVGVYSVVHEIGHTFNLGHGVENDSWELVKSGDGTKYRVSPVRYWADCNAMMAYRGANCYNKDIEATPSAPTFYETACVKSLYGLAGARPGFCQPIPEIRSRSIGPDKSVTITVKYECDDTAVKYLEVSVLQPLVPPNEAKGKASVPVTCDGKAHDQPVIVNSSTTSAFGSGKTAVTAHLVDADKKIKGNATPRQYNTIP